MNTSKDEYIFRTPLVRGENEEKIKCLGINNCQEYKVTSDDKKLAVHYTS